MIKCKNMIELFLIRTVRVATIYEAAVNAVLSRFGKLKGNFQFLIFD